jgi:predicted NodU family carbamoyl transferase
MRIVSVHSEHDASIAVVDDGCLVRHVEVQKDNGRRYASMPNGLLSDFMGCLDRPPDIFASGGWHGRVGGYRGHDESSIVASSADMHGHLLQQFATSHLRSHIFCAYGLSPFDQGQPCYALVWEGEIGSFYRVDEHCRVSYLGTPLAEPGHRYSFLFELADPSFSDRAEGWSLGVAGKLMALACQGRGEPLSADDEALLDRLLNRFDSRTHSKRDFCDHAYCSVGVLHPPFRRFATAFSDAIFDRFHAFACKHLNEKVPMLIVGGCALNCNWNTRWRECGLFADVFVPPCADDSGCAIGAAVDAQRHFTGDAKLRWNVYCGEPFIEDVAIDDRFERVPLDAHHLAARLALGGIVAWANGRYELGPRALGNRSLLAAPFASATRDRLNQIKQREPYRPVAPVCLEDGVSKWFDWQGPSEYMLHFQKVMSPNLQAVTHDDGSARVQTVSAAQNPDLHRLLVAFEALTGNGVLCNTSLNFPGRGFINRSSDLLRYVDGCDVDLMVINGRMYAKRQSSI